MARQIQYQRRAGPVTPPGQEAETTQLDKWYSPLSQPDRNYALRRLLASVLVVTAPFVASRPVPPQLVPDYFSADISQPRRTPPYRSQVSAQGPLSVDVPTPFLATQDAPSRLAAYRRQGGFFWNTDTPAGAATPSFQLVSAPESSRRLAGRPWLLTPVRFDPAPVPVPDISSWSPLGGQQLPGQKPRNYQPLFFVDGTIPAPAIPDIPQTVQGQPPRGNRERRYLVDAFFYGAPPIIPPPAPPVDGWYRPSELRPPRAFRSGYLLAGGYLVPQDFAPAPPPAPAPATTVKPMQGEATERIFAQVPEVATGQVVADSKQTIRAAVPEASSGSLGT